MPEARVVSEREYVERLDAYVSNELARNAQAGRTRTARVCDVGEQLARQADDIRAAATTPYAVACDTVRAVDEVTAVLAQEDGDDLRAGITMNAGTVLAWAAACASARRDRMSGWEFDGEAYVQAPVCGASPGADARAVTPPDLVDGYRDERSARTWVVPADLAGTQAARLLYVHLRTSGAGARAARATTLDALRPAPGQGSVTGPAPGQVRARGHGRST